MLLFLTIRQLEDGMHLPVSPGTGALWLQNIDTEV